MDTLETSYCRSLTLFDLKPDNVFVYANRVRLAHVVIGDFGVAINTNGEASWADHHGTKA